MRLEDQLRNLAHEMEDAQVPVSLDEIAPGIAFNSEHDRSGTIRPRSLWVAMVAATVVVLAGLGALVWWTADDSAPMTPIDTGVSDTTAPSTSTTAPSTSTPATTTPVDMMPTLDYRPDAEWFIPEVVPDGLEFRYAVRQSDVAATQDSEYIYFAPADCPGTNGCSPELHVSMRTDIDAASLGTTGDSSEAVEGIEDVFTFGPNSVLRRDGDAVADISGRGLSPEQLIEIARSTQLRPETELPRPPFICCRTLVEEEGNPGPVVAEFSLDTDDGAMTWVMTAHTDGRNIALGGYGTNDDTFGPTIALPIDSTATISSRPGRFVGPALPAGYDLVVGITRRDVAAVELKLTNNRTIKLPTTDLSGRFDARFVFAPIEVDDSTPQSNSGTPIVGFTAFDDNDNIIQPD